MGFKISQDGINLLTSLEGCRLTAYKLADEKYYTIGYGHSFDTNITAGTTITQQQAEEFLRGDLDKFEKYVNTYVKFPINQHMFDALVSYTYNRGKGGLLQLLDNSLDSTDCGNNMVVYWGSAKKYKKALINRRKKEQNLFFAPVVGTNTAVTKIQSSFNQNVLDFQRACNRDGVTDASGKALKEDGLYGKRTAEALQKVYLRQGSRGELVKFLQLRLGMSGKAVDGKFGPNTAAQTKVWQGMANLKKDGIAGPATFKSFIA